MGILNNLSSVKLLLYFFNIYRIGFIALILISTLLSVTPIIDSILLAKITDFIESSSQINTQSNLQNLLALAISYGLWWEALNITNRCYEYVYLKTVPKVKAKVVDELYNYVQHYEHNFFQKNLTGHVSNRIAEAARSLEMVFGIFNEQILRAIGSVIFALATLYFVNYKIASIFLVWITFFLLVSIICAKNINKLSTGYARKKSIVSGKIVDSVTNIAIVRLFNLYKSERKYLQAHLKDMVASEQKLHFLIIKLYYVLGLSCSLMIFAMVYFVAKLYAEGTVSVGDCVLVVALCTSIADDIYVFTQELGELFHEFGDFNQAMSLIQPYAIKDVADAKTLQVTNGEIKFNKVCFYYEHNKIFHDKSLTIKNKQKIGIVGASGSGKTSFVSLIYRLYDIESGVITIDNQDISKVTLESLRSSIGIIPQEPMLFSRSIMDNVRCGKIDATDEEVIKAAKLAHIDDFITSLPEGYNTICQEKGSNLSGGQKQRIAIARAILKNAPILILDEATSSLDTNTEKMIQQSLSYLMQEKTVIIIAHRLSTLLDMDRILVFSDGHLVEDGTHQELIDKGEVYRSLWHSQIGIVE